MLTPDAAREKVAQLVDRARRAGADAADAIYIGSSSQDVSVRMGALEDVGRSEGEEIGLRLFRGRRSASIASSDLADATLATMVERALAMAGEAPEDPYAGLAPDELLLRGTPHDLDLDDQCEPDPAALKARALAAEGAALGIAGVRNSGGASASASTSVSALATSTGFCAATHASGHGHSVTVIAGEGATMQRDYAWHSARHLSDLEDEEAIGRRAGERAVARLGPVKFIPGVMPVLFDPRVATTLVGHFVAAISGAAIARPASFLLGQLGQQIFAAGVTLIDDPLRQRGLRSRSFDSEGLPVAKRALVDDGVLTTWLADSASARQLGIAPTGHAVRGTSGAPGAGPSNLTLQPGSRSREAMIAGIDRGILLTELIGQGVNGVTGDYSRGAAGFLIERGTIVGPVAEITVASNLKDMFATLEPADDLQLRRGIDSPTLLVPQMTVGSA